MTAATIPPSWKYRRRLSCPPPRCAAIRTQGRAMPVDVCVSAPTSVAICASWSRASTMSSSGRARWPPPASVLRRRPLIRPPRSGLLRQLRTAALADVLHDAVRYEVPDGLVAPDTGPAIRGRDRKGGDLNEADAALGKAGIRQGVPRTSYPDEVRERDQLVRVPPRQDLRESVRAGDEVQLGQLAVQLFQVAQRVDGERRTAAIDVDPAHGEARVGRRGDHRHEVAILGRRHVSLGLLPRLSGRHEHDLVEVEQARDLAGGDQVTVMDGIECPAHDAEPSPRRGHDSRR